MSTELWFHKPIDVQPKFPAGNLTCCFGIQFVQKLFLSSNKQSIYFPDARIGKLDDCFGWRQAFFGGSRSKGKNFLKFMKDWIQRSCFQSWINFRKFLPLLREPPKKACLKPKQSSPTDQNSLRENIRSVCWKESFFFKIIDFLIH